MAKQTSFDLNLAIRHWREYLAQSPAFRTENLNELESHLRDSIAALQTGRLSEEEAFVIASRRVGNGQQLETEFAKVNRTATWADRILWMLIGVQIWKLVSDLVVSAATLAAYKFVSPALRDILGIVLEVILPPLAFGLLALAVWRSFSKPETKMRTRMARWLARPLAFAGGLFVFAVVVESLLGFLNAFSLARPDSGVVWTISPQFLSEYILAAALTFVYARKRLRAADA